HCISNYPTPAKDVNLNVMLEIGSRFNVPVGFSDHTIGNDAAIAAVALGATVIEKHVTYDKGAEGPDHKASATIEEFASLVQSIRNVEVMMGTKEKIFSKDELEIKKAARKSIVSTTDLKQGHVLQRKDLCFKRPGYGISPTKLELVIGKKLLKDIEGDRVILEEYLK
ncbi:MAG: N-acetylneuraminate synthase family protein, partial [Balneolaceae bacterium]|nr:N-acetylneuraminate synthase family protein [Balneolaceae bacterium]